MSNNVNLNNGNDLRNIMEVAIKAREEAKNRKEQASTNLESVNVSVKAAEQSKNDADTQLNKEHSDVITAEETVNTKQLTLQSLNTQYQELSNTLGLLDPEKNADVIANLNEKLKQLKEKINAANSELNEAEAALEKERVEEAEANRKLAESERQLEKAQSDLAKAEMELNHAAKELEQANSAYETAKADYEKFVEETAAANKNEDVAGADFTPISEEEAVAAGYTVIHNIEEFLNIGSDLNGKYILMGNIDLDGVDWTPIGSSESPFTGVLNGNGFRIENLSIQAYKDDAENIGLFGVTENAAFSNLNITDAKVSTLNDMENGSNSVGILVGLAKGTNFDNITISGDVVGYEKVGGLVGNISDYDRINDNFYGNSSIKNVTANVNVESSYYAGGIVGHVDDTIDAHTLTKWVRGALTLSNCSVNGDINVTEESAGGIIGEAGKTIVTLENCTNNADMKWNNLEDDSDLSFLMETGRIGGLIGCANGTYLTIVGCEFNGDIDADTEFKGEDYGWYMNDAQISIYDIPGGLPIDDILKIEGVDALTPSYNDGIPNYEVTVSTLTGLDKVVTMLEANPELAELITFNVNFDFEYMDGKYDATVYNQYGIVQNIYEDEDGVVHNDTYIDNEICLESTFHTDFVSCNCNRNCQLDSKNEHETMVKGLYKDDDGAYYIKVNEGTEHEEQVTVKLKFHHDKQVTNVTKRLTESEVKFRNYMTEVVYYFQQTAHNALKAMFGYDESDSIPIISKAEYKKLLKKAEKMGGIDKLPKDAQLAIAAYEVDYKIMNIVSESTHNYGCGMGGKASFLEETKTYQMYDEQGRALYTDLKGNKLVQKVDESGMPILDEEGLPLYEFADGSGDYTNPVSAIFEQRGYQIQDENGNLLFTDAEGKSLTRIENDGNIKFVYEDNSELEVKETKDTDGNIQYTYIDSDGNEQILNRTLEEYSLSDEIGNVKSKIQDLCKDVENGKYPLGNDASKNETENTNTPASTTDETEPLAEELEKLPEEE